MYYATYDRDFSEDTKIRGSIDYENSVITFDVPSNLEKRITGLRLDFPAEDKIVKMDSVSISSGGLIKKNYTGDYFFTGGNIPYMHGIGSISLVTSRGVAYIKTLENDPYVILSESLTNEIGRCFSHYYISRGLLVLLIVLFAVSYRINLFGEKNEK
jgi:hypothetical protein